MWGRGVFPFLWPLYRPLLSGKRFLNLLSLNARKVYVPPRPQNSLIAFYFSTAVRPSLKVALVGMGLSAQTPHRAPKGKRWGWELGL